MPDLHVAIATPSEHSPDPGILERTQRLADRAGRRLEVFDSAEDAVRDADVVYTDAWPSMDDPDEQERVFGPFRVDGRLFARAGKDAVFLHCLPAHRGQEVTAEVIDGPRSFAFRRLTNLTPTSVAVIQWPLDSAR